jgi:hypothetical protein
MMTRGFLGMRQVLSAGAVVMSLIFVGLEIRQSTAAQRAQTRQGLAEGSRELILTLATNPRLSDAYYTIFPRPGRERPGQHLTASDSMQARVFLFAQLRNAENVYLQFREGVVDESVLKTYAFEDTRYHTETFREWWGGGAAVSLDTGFVRAFEQANGIR